MPTENDFFLLCVFAVGDRDVYANTTAAYADVSATLGCGCCSFVLLRENGAGGNYVPVSFYLLLFAKRKK